jgi:hypothetical protein
MLSGRPQLGMRINSTTDYAVHTDDVVEAFVPDAKSVLDTSTVTPKALFR